MDRLARNLDDLRRLVQSLTKRGVAVQFLKENMTFIGEDTPMANLMLSVMGAFAEFERALIKERQREGIALAKQRGVYTGRKRVLSSAQVAELRRRAATEPKAALVAMASTACWLIYRRCIRNCGRMQRRRNARARRSWCETRAKSSRTATAAG
jgi:DNA invertase Pin-like site-specific DNA recombinase